MDAELLHGLPKRKKTGNQMSAILSSFADDGDDLPVPLAQQVRPHLKQNYELRKHNVSCKN